MKKIILSLLFFSTQTLMAHPDCVSVKAPMGGIGSNVSSDRVDNVIIASAIKAKEKLDELITLFNRSRVRKINVYSALDTVSTLDQPLIFSPAIIAQKLESLKAEMKPELKKAIFENGLASINLITEVDIKKYGSKISGLYDLAIRYDHLIKNKTYYIDRSNKDVRGFYYFQTKKTTAQSLVDFRFFDDSTKRDITSALMGICKNNKIKAYTCQREINTAVRRDNVHAVYSKYINGAIHNWNSFFLIPNTAVRTDVIYRNGILEVPFKSAESKEIQDFLTTIETTWTKFGVGVSLNFQQADNIPNFSFKTNAVAHVNKLGGNNIVMNAGSDMNSAGAKFTISHEFGHVLGFPDCYIEFYDEEQDAFINYQLSKTDLMCSSQGKVTLRMKKEVERVYGSNRN